MDVLSQSEMRMREKMKRIRPLDHVIRRAVAEEEAEAAMAGAPTPAPAAAQAKVRFAGPSAEEEREARRHHRAAHKHRQRRHREKKPWERVHIMEEGTGDEARGASAGRSDATKTREDYAQEGERPVSFAASVGRFDGKPKNMKAYPHHLAPGVLRRQMGMASRTADLNAELAKAREAKFDADMRAMADAEAGCAEALRQSDGKRLRLARLGSPLTWQMCGFLALRGKMFGWHWTRAYYVLTNNILYVFPTNASSARVKIALPILGALVRALAPSSKHHPFVFELSVNPYFMERDVLSLFELSAPRRDEHTRWIRSIRYTSARVSPLFRRTGDRSQHVHEVEGMSTKDAKAAVKKAGAQETRLTSKQAADAIRDDDLTRATADLQKV